MKKVLFICTLILAVFTSCLKNNDLVNPEVVAEILSFEVEGQVSSSIDKNKKTVTVLMPAKSDLTQLKISQVRFTDNAVCSPDIAAGTVLDLSAAKQVTLHIFDDYVWTISAENEPDYGDLDITRIDTRIHSALIEGKASPAGTTQIQWRKAGVSSWTTAQGATVANGIISVTVTGLESETKYEARIVAGKVNGPVKSFTTRKEGVQLYNMSFDHWTQSGKIWYCYDSNASEAEKAVWGNANKTMSDVGKDSNTVPETDFVAVAGEGKKAVKLTTRLLNFIILKKLASGSLFTGKLGDVNITTMSANLHWGVPFTDRPVAMEGYASYRPAKINQTESPYKDMAGKMDSGHVFVLLTDWDEPFKVTPPSKLVDFDGDPSIIGYGKVVFDKETTEYEKFTLNIEYRNDRTPKYVVIVASSSALGDYFTGGEGSVLYLDEFKFLYE